MKPAPPVTTIRSTAESGRTRTLVQISGGCNRLIVMVGGSPNVFAISKCTISFNCLRLMGKVDCDDSYGGEYRRNVNVIKRNEMGTIHICSVIHFVKEEK